MDFLVFFDVVLICVDSFKFLSKAYEHFHSLVLNIPFHFYFPSIKPNELLIALSTTLSSFCAFRHTSCAYFLQEAFMNSQEELVNHTKVGRDSMTWVPSSTSNTYELYNLNILLGLPGFPYLINKVVILILIILQGYKACVFKPPGICSCSINACFYSPLLSFPSFVLPLFIIQ